MIASGQLKLELGTQYDWKLVVNTADFSSLLQVFPSKAKHSFLPRNYDLK